MKMAIAILLLLIPFCSAQKSTGPKNGCNDDSTFCWYDDEMTASGNHWVSQASSKRLTVGVGIRCLKRFNVCIHSHSYHAPLNKELIVGHIEVMPVSHWDDTQIRANAENADWEPCDRDSYIISRLDHSVLLISSPGPEAETSGCTGVLGKPQTVVYKLAP